MDTELKRTPLYPWHRERGARMSAFAGWEMPLWYTRISEEVLAVRRAAGLFDVSHMGQLELRGPHALAALQVLGTNDARRLRDGQAQYSLLCCEDGGVLDDIIAYRLAADRYLLCVNAANTARDREWIETHASGAEVVDLSEETALLALQGPRASDILATLGLTQLASVRRFHFTTTSLDGAEVILARTGYTGEDGWELFCPQAQALAIWGRLLDAGKPFGLVPCGLGARDLLRLEAALPLYGHELHERVTPLEAGLAWAVRFEKEAFIGREALQRQAENGIERKLAGMVLTGEGIPRQGYAVMVQGTQVGEVTSGGKSPTLGKSIALGYLATAFAKVGATVEIDIRGRAAAACVVALPFYKR